MHLKNAAAAACSALPPSLLVERRRRRRLRRAAIARPLPQSGAAVAERAGAGPAPRASPPPGGETRMQQQHVELLGPHVQLRAQVLEAPSVAARHRVRYGVALARDVGDLSERGDVRVGGERLAGSATCVAKRRCVPFFARACVASPAHHS
eukprot:1939603-Pleurochrysis_carterae.AAC.2